MKELIRAEGAACNYEKMISRASPRTFALAAAYESSRVLRRFTFVQNRGGHCTRILGQFRENRPDSRVTPKKLRDRRVTVGTSGYLGKWKENRAFG